MDNDGSHAPDARCAADEYRAVPAHGGRGRDRWVGGVGVSSHRLRVVFRFQVDLVKVTFLLDFFSPSAFPPLPVPLGGRRGKGVQGIGLGVFRRRRQGQGLVCHGMAWHGMAGQDRTGQDRTGLSGLVQLISGSIGDGNDKDNKF